MTRSGIKGVNLLVSIGIPGLLAPVATYAAPQNPGGLPIISSIANEPTSMLYIPTSKNSDLSKTKTSERVKFNGGTEVGDTFEQDEAITGSIEALIVRSVASDAYYDPAIELLIQAANTSNYNLYIKLEIYLGLASATLGHSYHVRSAIVKPKSDGSPHPSDSKAVMKTFQLEGSGSWIEGYQYKL